MKSFTDHEGLTIERAIRQTLEDVQFILCGYPRQPLPDGTLWGVEDIARKIAKELNEFNFNNVRELQRMPKFSAIKTSLRRFGKMRTGTNKGSTDNYRSIDPNFSYVVNQCIYEW